MPWLAAALALAFVHCQARIVGAAKGIPAWREPLVVPLMVLTGLAEGAGLALAVQPSQAAGQPLLLALVAALVLARLVVWRTYRRRLTPRARTALEAAGRWLQITDAALPGLLLVLAVSGAVGQAWAMPLLTAAGLSVAATGMFFKFTLITRAGFNQGFALAHLPVRGVRR